jgi:hypothetical protein
MWIVYMMLGIVFGVPALFALMLAFVGHCEAYAATQSYVCNPRTGVCRDKVTGERVS